MKGKVSGVYNTLKDIVLAGDDTDEYYEYITDEELDNIIEEKPSLSKVVSEIIKAFVSYNLWGLLLFYTCKDIIDSDHIIYFDIVSYGTIFFLCMITHYYFFSEELNLNILHSGIITALFYVLYVSYVYIDMHIKFLLIMAAVYIVIMMAVIIIFLRKDIEHLLEERKKEERIFEIASCGIALLFFMLVFCCVFMVISSVIIPLFSSGNRVTSEDYEKYFTDNIAVLKKFDESEWKNLDYGEKTEVMQKMADVEQRRLGIPHSMKVIIREVDTDIPDGEAKRGGYYSPGKNEITISKSSVDKASSWWVLNAVCHECYHGYEHSIIDLYRESDETMHDLAIFEDAKKYAYEFDNYVGVLDDVDIYYSQLCEEDARKHGEEVTYQYYRWIKKYIRDESVN